MPAKPARPLTCFALHGFQDRQDLRIAVRQRANEHDLGHQTDQRTHAPEIELHAAAEDKDMRGRALPSLAGRQCADTLAERRGGERGDVAARQVGSRDDIVDSAAREQHGIPPVHLMNIVALTQKDRAASDEMELCAAVRGPNPRPKGGESSIRRYSTPVRRMPTRSSFNGSNDDLAAIGFRMNDQSYKRF